MASLAGSMVLGGLARQAGGSIVEKGAEAGGGALGGAIGGKKGRAVGKAVGKVVGKIGKGFFGFQSGGVVQNVTTPTGQYMSVTKVRTPPSGMKRGGVVKRRRKK